MTDKNIHLKMAEDMGEIKRAVLDIGKQLETHGELHIEVERKIVKVDDRVNKHDVLIGKVGVLFSIVVFISVTAATQVFIWVREKLSNN